MCETWKWPDSQKTQHYFPRQQVDCFAKNSPSKTIKSIVRFSTCPRATTYSRFLSYMRIIILCDGEPTPFALRLVHRENGTYKMCAALIIGIEPIARNILKSKLSNGKQFWDKQAWIGYDTILSFRRKSTSKMEFKCQFKLQWGKIFFNYFFIFFLIYVFSFFQSWYENDLTRNVNDQMNETNDMVCSNCNECHSIDAVRARIR